MFKKLNKIFLFLLLSTLFLLLLGCEKSNNLSQQIKKINEKITLEIHNDFNYDDKIITKNDTIYLSDSIVTKLGKFINYERFLSFKTFYDNLEIKPICCFSSHMTFDAFYLQNANKIEFKHSFEDGINKYEFEIPFFLLDHDENGAISFPFFDGFFISLSQGKTNIKNQTVEIKLETFSKKENINNLLYLQCETGEIISYHKFENKNFEQVKNKIIILPDILELSEKYLSLAKNIYELSNETSAIYILNLPGISGSSNNLLYDNLNDLKSWFLNILEELITREVSIIASGASSLILYATLFDCNIQKKYSFKNLIVINPISPNGLGLYKDSNIPYSHPKELIDNKEIAKIDKAIRYKDYSFFNNYLKNDPYYKSLDFKAKENYLNKIVNKRGFLNIIYALNNITIFKNEYSLGYEILTKDLKDYTFEPDFIKKDLKEIIRNNNVGDDIKKRYQIYEKEHKEIVDKYNLLKSSHNGYQNKYYNSLTYKDLADEIGVNISNWNDFIPIYSKTLFNKILFYYDKDYFFDNLNSLFEIDNGMVYSVLISKYNKKNINFYKYLGEIIAKLTNNKLYNESLDPGFSPKNIFLMFKDLITILNMKLSFNDYKKYLCFGRFSGCFDYSQLDINYDEKYQEFTKNNILNNYSISSKELSNYILGKTTNIPNKSPLDFIGIIYLYLKIFENDNLTLYNNIDKIPLFFKRMKYFLFKKEFNELSSNEILNGKNDNYEFLKKKKELQIAFVKEYEKIDDKLCYDLLKTYLKDPNKLKDDILNIDNSYLNIFIKDK